MSQPEDHLAGQIKSLEQIWLKVKEFDDNDVLSRESHYTQVISKYLLIASASHLEELTKKAIRAVVGCGSRHEILPALVNQKVLARGYHGLFDWKAQNVNNFFSIFGKEYRGYMERKIASDERFNDGALAFLWLGNMRNEHIHSNIAAYEGSTPIVWSDILEKFSKAQDFITSFQEYSLEYIEANAHDEAAQISSERGSAEQGNQDE